MQGKRSPSVPLSSVPANRLNSQRIKVSEDDVGSVTDGSKAPTRALSPLCGK